MCSQGPLGVDVGMAKLLLVGFDAAVFPSLAQDMTPMVAASVESASVVKDDTAYARQ